MLTIDYDEVLRERMIVGTPGRVVDRLKRLQEELGLDGILAELNPGSLIPHAQVMTGAASFSAKRSCRASSERRVGGIELLPFCVLRMTASRKMRWR